MGLVVGGDEVNWSHHAVGIAIAFLIATVLVVSGLVWAVLILVGGQPLAHEILGENVVRMFMVITFAFLAVTQVLVMVFFWGTLIIVGGKWLMFHFRRFWETDL
jgi:hypothetical protein